MLDVTFAQSCSLTKFGFDLKHRHVYLQLDNVVLATTSPIRSGESSAAHLITSHTLSRCFVLRGATQMASLLDSLDSSALLIQLDVEHVA